MGLKTRLYGMLQYCENLASTHNLTFNADKTQPICFGTQHSHLSSARINFCSTQLVFLDVVTHLGHHLSFNLSDSTDILHSTRDLVKQANLMLITFATADPLVKSRLLQYYCLSLCGCALWNLSSPALYSIEVAFNNILRHIWHLPRSCHTRILHLTARLPSIFNATANRSLSLLNSAKICSSKAVRTVFTAFAHYQCTHPLVIMPFSVKIISRSITSKTESVLQLSDILDYMAISVTPTSMI